LTLTNKASAAELKAKPDAEGHFRFESVPEGDYTLKAKAEGFDTLEVGVKVRTTEPKPLRLRMELKTHDEEVTVTAEREPGLSLDPGENSNAMKIDESLLGALPVDGQDVLGTLTRFLSPAAQGAMGPSVIVDGMEADSFDVPDWSIKRIRINKNPYSAQFRRPGSSRIEVTTRDSRSNFHGGVSFFDHESLLDTRNPVAATKPDMSKRAFQGRVTGPIHGTKVWYFANFERVNDKQSAVIDALTPAGPINLNVPTPAFRTNFLGRLDFRPSQMHSMDVRYVLAGNTQHNRGVGGLRLAEGGYSTAGRESSFQFADHLIFNSGFNNEFRVQFERSEDREGGLASSPSIVVKGAFTSGPSPTFDSERSTTFRVQNVTNFYNGRHRVQFGGQVRPRYIDARQQSDFAGVFEFANLDRFAAGQPFVFRVNQGDPAVSFTQHEAFSFVQDRFLLTPTLQLLAGVRHEWQGGIGNAHHVAPRIGLAWSPSQSRNTVIRVGAGVFYESVPKSITRRSLLLDGTHLNQFIIPSPSFPDPFAGGGESQAPPSVVRVSRDLTLPYLFQASAGIERAITNGAHFTAEYRSLRGVHIYRSRDINAPLSAAALRPDPSRFSITNVESDGTMRSNAFETSVRWSAKRFAGMAQYTYSRTYDDAYGLFASPANSYDLHTEWGRSDQDRRHVLNLMGSFNAPGKVRIGTVTTIGSALPFNITTGEDNNGDAVATDRPAGISRNTGVGAGLVQVDMRFTRLFEARRLYKRHKKDFNNLELSVDLFNVLNHANYGAFVGVLNSPFYGRAISALPGRRIQTALRYSW
jgi:hypothetical protein